MRVINTESRARGRIIEPGSASSPTITGQATAPALHDTLTKLTADASWPGFIRAIKKFVVGRTSPSPQP